MIEREGYDYCLYCDKCNVYKDGFDSWQDVINFKKDKKNDWGSRQENGDWIDLCPNCINDWKNKKNPKKDIKTKEVNKNFINPTFKGWELLKRVEQNEMVIGQKIKLVIANSDDTIMQNSNEIFKYNGFGFINNNKEYIESQISLIDFGNSNFEYVV